MSLETHYDHYLEMKCLSPDDKFIYFMGLGGTSK